MLKYNKIIVVIFILFFSVTLYSEVEKDEYCYNEKDPFVAGLLSATMLGLGQIYTKDYLKGSIFVFTDLLQKGMIIYLASYLSDRYTDDDKNDKIVEWREIDNADRSVLIGFIVFYFGSRLYCIVDAISGANRYNENLRKEYSGKDIKLNYHLTTESFGLGLSSNF